MSLYREFRPNEWDDVVGQSHVKTILKNQIAADEIGHGYLFVGTRGIGKTTIARIFARMVNVKHVEEDYNLEVNVIEIDAASNNGVDNVRQIRQEANHKPAKGKYKVYIIDECHMLSAGAFNAMLKILEEPPEHIIFCLATTEAHKLPATILSRCQRFDLQRFDTETIYGRLKYIVTEKSISIEESALKHIAKLGRGSMRDAISILDQVRSLKDDISFNDLLKLFGSVSVEILESIMEHLKEPGELMRTLKAIYFSGTDMRRLISDLYSYGNDCLLVQKMGVDNCVEYINVSPDYLPGLEKNSKTITFRFLEGLQELSSELRYSDNEYLLIQNKLLKLGGNV